MKDKVLYAAVSRLDRRLRQLRQSLAEMLERDGYAMVDGRTVEVGNDGLTAEERQELLVEFRATVGAKPPAGADRDAHRDAVMLKLRPDAFHVTHG